jgi:SPP1 gp7 family putative phage head morphogenesis protein
VRTWPAKRVQSQLAVKNSVKIKAALSLIVNPKTVAKEYVESHPFLVGSQTIDRVHARSWAMIHVRPNLEPLRQAVARTIVEGWVTGEKAAGSEIKRSIKKNLTIQQILEDEEVDVWANWKPGDQVSAALLERKYGLDQLLIQSELTIKNMAKTQIDEIGTQLADGLSRGLSIDEIASSLKDVINNPAKALSIAMTETSRATNFGAQNRYREANILKNQWSGIDPCPECAMNDGEIVGVGDPFASGDTQPPAHPNCLCTLLPVIETNVVEDISEEVLVLTDDAFELAKGREERLTEEMVGISRAVGGVVSGLRFRLKQPKSIARKIRGMVKDGEFATAKEAADSLADLNRYTLSFTNDVYVAGVKNTIEELTAKGYGLRVKNYWERADYKGINIAVKDATGKEFEVQLHSASSLGAKEDLHILYERYRVNTNDKERWDLWTKMVNIAKQIETPANFDELKTIGILKHEYFKDSKGNYREALGGKIIDPKKLNPPNKIIPPIKVDEINPIDLFPEAVEGRLQRGPRAPQVALVRPEQFRSYKEYTQTPDNFYQENLTGQFFDGAQFRAVNGYQEAGHRAINLALRKEQVMEPALAENIAEIRRAIAQAVPLKEDTILYRGIKKDFDKFTVGQIFSDKGFLSTTVRSDLAAEWADRKNVSKGFIFKIYAPKGTRGLIPNFVTASKAYDSEYEFLLDIGTKFEVISVDPVQRIVEVRILNGQI